MGMDMRLVFWAKDFSPAGCCEIWYMAWYAGERFFAPTDGRLGIHAYPRGVRL